MALKTTTKRCFPNGSEFTWWLERNCYKCKKNATIDRDGFEKFHCVIQADIFFQSVCGDEIREISYKAAQEAKCPRFIECGAPAKRHRPKKEKHIPGQLTIF